MRSLKNYKYKNACDLYKIKAFFIKNYIPCLVFLNKIHFLYFLKKKIFNNCILQHKIYY